MFFTNISDWSICKNDAALSSSVASTPTLVNVSRSTFCRSSNESICSCASVGSEWNSDKSTSAPIAAFLFIAFSALSFIDTIN